MSQRDNRKSCHSDQHAKYLVDPAEVAPKKLPKKLAVRENCGARLDARRLALSEGRGRRSDPVGCAKFQALSEPHQQDPPARKHHGSMRQKVVGQPIASPSACEIVGLCKTDRRHTSVLGSWGSWRCSQFGIPDYESGGSGVRVSSSAP